MSTNGALCLFLFTIWWTVKYVNIWNTESVSVSSPLINVEFVSLTEDCECLCLSIISKLQGTCGCNTGCLCLSTFGELYNMSTYGLLRVSLSCITGKLQRPVEHVFVAKSRDIRVVNLYFLSYVWRRGPVDWTVLILGQLERKRYVGTVAERLSVDFLFFPSPTSTPTLTPPPAHSSVLTPGV